MSGWIVAALFLGVDLGFLLAAWALSGFKLCSSCGMPTVPLDAARDAKEAAPLSNLPPSPTGDAE